MPKVDEVLELLLKIFFEHQIQIKMFHFQTKTYGSHKASDEYLNKVNATFDQLMEVAQGIFGRFTTSQISIKVVMVDDNNIGECLDKFINVIMKTSVCYKDRTDLTNIRDEIVANANQFKYLLTFK